MVRVTFGMIVLNGEPFTRYNLRSLYPWAHQIIVVEGACRAASMVAGKNGHSTDGTLEGLRRFQSEEDPEGKVVVVTAEDEGHPDGFWPGEKDEMSRAYATRATGNYLWQVDVDEFYREEDMPRILALLGRGVDAVSFPTLSFWGGIGFLENGEYFIAHGLSDTDRIFAWGKGYRYTTHRPATVCDEAGVDTRRKMWVKGRDLKKEKIYMYHYSMLLPKQVREKCSYYSRVDWASFQRMEQWAEEVFFSLAKPFSVCNSLHCPVSWIERFAGSHPHFVLQMVAGIEAGRHPGVELRDTADMDRLLETRGYRAGRFLRRIRAHALLAFWTLRRLLQKSPYHPALFRLYLSCRARLTRLRGRRGSPLEPVSRKFGLDRGRSIDRHYIERFLADCRSDIAGRVLEIGAPEYTRAFATEPFVSEVLHVEPGHPEATMVGDLSTGAGIPRDAFDCLLLTQTFPFIYDVQAAVRHAHASLRPGGVLLATLPGISQISRHDMDRWGDYWRFTTASAARLFSEVFGADNVTVESFGNVSVACAFLTGLAVEELTSEQLAYNDRDYQVLITVRAVRDAQTGCGR